MEEMRQRIDKDKLKRIEAYERDFQAVIKDYKFEPLDLVLVRNTAIESSLDKKMKPRYFGPLFVVAENKGGLYILAELTGAVWHQKVAKFREIPEGIMSILDTDEQGLDKIKSQPDEDVVLSKEYLMDNVRMNLSDSDHE